MFCGGYGNKLLRCCSWKDHCYVVLLCVLIGANKQLLHGELRKLFFTMLLRNVSLFYYYCCVCIRFARLVYVTRGVFSGVSRGSCCRFLPS